MNPFEHKRLDELMTIYLNTLDHRKKLYDEIDENSERLRVIEDAIDKAESKTAMPIFPMVIRQQKRTILIEKEGDGIEAKEINHVIDERPKVNS